MHRDISTFQVRDNFAYLARRAIHLLDTLPADRLASASCSLLSSCFSTSLPALEPAGERVKGDRGHPANCRPARGTLGRVVRGETYSRGRRVSGVTLLL